MTIHVLLGDVHFGVKNGDKTMLKHQLNFFRNQLLPFCEANQIDSILQTGDLFDVRKNSNNLVCDEVKALFQEINKTTIDFNGIVGNHDAYHKNSNDINSPKLHLSDYYAVVESFDTMYFGHHSAIDMVGWMNSENTDSILEEVAKSTSRYCFGHFEFAGFEMNKGYVAEHGLDHKIFKKYDLVISGHYHSSSRKDNVLYVGTPMQFTWADYGEKKGFWVFDDHDGSTVFIENPVNLFEKIEYDEDNLPQDFSIYKDKWVRLLVNKKTDEKKYETFLKTLNRSQPAELKIIENLIEHNENYRVEDVDITNASDIMRRYVEQTKFGNLDSTKIFNRLDKIYKEALLKK